MTPGDLGCHPPPYPLGFYPLQQSLQLEPELEEAPGYPPLSPYSPPSDSPERGGKGLQPKTAETSGAAGPRKQWPSPGSGLRSPLAAANTNSPLTLGQVTSGQLRQASMNRSAVGIPMVPMLCFDFSSQPGGEGNQNLIKGFGFYFSKAI